MKSKYLSRAFILTVIILLLNFYCFFFDKTDFIPALTILDGGITAFIGFGSYFKERNYKG
jgi:hypothetical protein